MVNKPTLGRARSGNEVAEASVGRSVVIVVFIVRRSLVYRKRQPWINALTRYSTIAQPTIAGKISTSCICQYRKEKFSPNSRRISRNAHSPSQMPASPIKISPATPPGMRRGSSRLAALAQTIAITSLTSKLVRLFIGRVKMKGKSILLPQLLRSTTGGLNCAN